MSALATRYSPKKLAPPPTRIRKKSKARPLFVADEDEQLPEPESESEDNDAELALALQESLEQAEESDLRRALEASRTQRVGSFTVSSSNIGASTSGSMLDSARHLTPERRRSSSHAGAGLRGLDLSDQDDDDDDDLYASPSRLETALAIGGAGPLPHRRPLSRVVSQPHISPTRHVLASSPPQSSGFGIPSLLLPRSPSARLVQPVLQSEEQTPADSPPERTESESDADMVEVAVDQVPSSISHPAVPQAATPIPVALDVESSDDEDMEEVVPSTVRVPSPVLKVAKQVQTPHTNIDVTSVSPLPPTPEPHVSPPRSSYIELPVTPVRGQSTLPTGDDSELEYLDDVPSVTHPASNPEKSPLADDDHFSRSPSPVGEPSQEEAAIGEHEDWDAAQEMDAAAEEGEFARFISQVKDKDIEAVRRDIDDEIRDLNQQRKAAMRDSEDITQQMVSQIMVRCSVLCLGRPKSDRGRTDHAAPLWHPVYHRADGGGGAVRRAACAWPRRWDHHGRLGRFPFRRRARAQEYV